jgi:hypothetical protein
MSGLTPGPFSLYTKDKVGEHAQNNYKFLEALFGPSSLGPPPTGQELRDYLLSNNDATLRADLAGWFGIVVPAGVRILIVDIENARTTLTPDAIKDPYYVLVLPPSLRRKLNDDSYLDAQALSGAWYHATSDGYGM